MLLPEIAGDRLELLVRSRCRRWSRILEVRICKAPPAMTNPERIAAARGEKGKAEATSRKTTGTAALPN